MRVVSEGVAEIRHFVDGLTLSSPLSDPHSNTTFGHAYRYVHALLIWNEVLSSARKAKPNVEALLHFRELLSDLAAAQFLLLAGMYKPARMMLRSSVENILRVAAHEQGFLAAGAKFSYELIALVKSSKLHAADSPVKSDVNGIIGGYTKLCAYTHAASEPLMSLRIPLVSVAAFDQDEFDSIVADLRMLASRYNCVIYTLYRQHLKTASHKHHDFILDALPKVLKAHFSA